MIDIILLKIKKHIDLNDKEQEFIFLEALQRFIDNTDEIAHFFIKTNIEHLISAYIMEKSFVSSEFIEQLSNLIKNIQTLSPSKKADSIYFIVRYLLSKRKNIAAIRYAVLFLSQLSEQNRNTIDNLTLSYLEHFATEHDIHINASNRTKETMALVYSNLEKFSSRKFLTPEFLENPFHPYFKDYDSQIHRILAISSLAKIKEKSK